MIEIRGTRRERKKTSADRFSAQGYSRGSMNRTLIGTLILVTFAAGVVYLAMGQFKVRCHVCVGFGVQRKCESAVASNAADAEQQATYGACSQITRGVTDIVRCTGSVPQSVRCEE